jgi:hypothetical protein
MPVPKAAMDKNYFLEFRKYQIRGAWEIFAMKAVSKWHAMNHPPNSQLDSRILAMDQAHPSATTFGRECIHAVVLP